MPSRIFVAHRVSKDNGGSAVPREWTPLHLNKQVYNGTSSVFFDEKTGRFELQPGTYCVKSRSVFFNVAGCKIAIMVPSKPPDPIICGSPGYGEYSSGGSVGGESTSFLEGVWTVEHTSSVYLYYWVYKSNGISDLGMRSEDGLDNVYTSLLIQEL